MALLCIAQTLFTSSGYHYHDFQVHIAFRPGAWFKESKLNCKAFTAKFSGRLTFQELWLVARFSNYDAS